MHDSTSTNLLNLPPKQPYRINNCKFQNSMLSFLSELHNTKAYTDVVLHADGKLLQAHRVVLAAGSSYFNNLFKSLSPAPRTTSEPQCQQNIVIALPNVRYKDLEKVVKFIYFGYLDIVNSELEGFVDLAKQLGVVGMSDDEDDDDNDAHQTEQHQQLINSQQETLNEQGTAAAEEEEEEPNDTTVQDYDDEDDNDEYVGELENEQMEDPPIIIKHENVSSSLTPSNATTTFPPEYLQVAFTDDDEEQDEMDEDEDEENSGDYGASIGQGPSASPMLFLNEKPFVCLKCGKTYNSNKSLWRHKKFTCDEKIEFKCDVCGKVFSRSDNLRRHITVAH